MYHFHLHNKYETEILPRLFEPEYKGRGQSVGKIQNHTLEDFSLNLTGIELEL